MLLLFVLQLYQQKRFETMAASLADLSVFSSERLSPEESVHQMTSGWATQPMSGLHRGLDSSTALCKLCHRVFAILNVGEVLFVPM